MSNAKKKLVVVGDRVLIVPEEGEERTSTGLLLPKSALDSMAVQSGRVVALGPGTPVGSNGGPDEEEPWKQRPREPRYFPMQAREGDIAIFFRRAAVEVTFEGKAYLVVPHQAILLLVRSPAPPAPSDELPIDTDF